MRCNSTLLRRLLLRLSCFAALFALACQPTTPGHASSGTDPDICAIARDGQKLELVRPADDEEPIDDVNWFARPLWNQRGDWIIGFASHDQNYLYNLSSGARVPIPGRSDAVATPDGLYMTVPSYYTPDQNIHFYDAQQLLSHLDGGQDASQVSPVYIHDHPDLHQVYYQSTGVVETDSETTTIYRLMFSGTRSESGFRIVDYEFRRDPKSADLTVQASEPMRLCPEIPNDMNTPFISKDGRYVASYTSTSDNKGYSPGASLKLFRILETRPTEGTTRCEEIVDFGFAAGKADFSFDGSKLTFHISKGAYLTPFVNGGLESPTITDVVVVNLTRDTAGNINGYSGMSRLTTSLRQGVGSYFPAFFPDGKLFFVFNAEPKESEAVKRFSFKVVDPEAASMMTNVFADVTHHENALTIAGLWENACAPGEEPFKEHEAPWLLTSLSREQCRALVESHDDAQTLLETCALR